jgi:hypothetical protein
MCPVCTVAVGFGLGLSRWLKIDDSISGVWIGAFIVSLSAVTATFLVKYIHLSHKLLTFLSLIVYLTATVIPFWYGGVIGHPLNTIYGIDKLIFGMSAGIILFYASHGLHLGLKKKNGDKVFFPFQKVFIPIWTLLIASIVLFLMTRV